jgi:hypothetical protein
VNLASLFYFILSLMVDVVGSGMTATPELQECSPMNRLKPSLSALSIQSSDDQLVRSPSSPSNDLDESPLRDDEVPQQPRGRLLSSVSLEDLENARYVTFFFN